MIKFVGGFVLAALIFIGVIGKVLEGYDLVSYIGVIKMCNYFTHELNTKENVHVISDFRVYLGCVNG